MEKRPQYKEVEEIQREYQERKQAIRNRLAEFAAVRPDEYFYELVYCLLTPQSSAVNAGRAVEALKAVNLFGSDVDAAPLLHQKNFYIRFHNTKAKRLREVREGFPDIMRHLCNRASSPQLRAWLVENVKGLGWKEASHFLRNIGHRDLAILDRHILKNLKKHGVIRSLPHTLTPKRYLAIEQQFSGFAQRIGISMDELDLLLWSRETGEIFK
ncbi:MAG: N-glycosylase/DNA lyase [Bacteroidetes bacterium]|nr:N-glycosylase/DNA lyase [Bacteroidota bacterium]